MGAGNRDTFKKWRGPEYDNLTNGVMHSGDNVFGVQRAQELKKAILKAAESSKYSNRIKIIQSTKGNILYNGVRVKSF